jgi:hypothetical protein
LAGKIAKEGSHWLRWVMVEVVQTHICNYDTSIARAYNRGAGKTGKKIANVAALGSLRCVVILS